MTKSSLQTTTVGSRAFDVGFAALVIVVPLLNPSETTFVAYYPKLLAFHAILAVLYGIWIFRWKSIRFRRSPLTLPVILFTAVLILSITQAVNRVESLVQIAHQIGLTLLFLLLLQNIAARNHLQYLRIVAGVGTVVALIGILQFAGWGFLWLRTAGPPSATLGYRNYAAMYMILCIPLGACLFLESSKKGSVWIWVIATAAMTTFLICTRTRGAWLGLSVACLVVISILAILRNRIPALKRLHAT